MSAKEDKTAKMLPLLIELANSPPQDMIPQGGLLAKREEEGRGSRGGEAAVARKSLRKCYL